MCIRDRNHTSTSCLRKTNRNGLLGGACPVLPLSNMMDLLPDEFSSLGRRRFPLPFCFPRFSESFLFRHRLPPGSAYTGQEFRVGPILLGIVAPIGTFKFEQSNI